MSASLAPKKEQMKRSADCNRLARLSMMFSLQRFSMERGEGVMIH